MGPMKPGNLFNTKVLNPTGDILKDEDEKIMPFPLEWALFNFCDLINFKYRRSLDGKNIIYF